MKTKCKFEKGFKPFKVEIEFETELEARNWSQMLGYHRSIPVIACIREDYRNQIAGQMADVLESINQGLFQ